MSAKKQKQIASPECSGRFAAKSEGSSARRHTNAPGESPEARLRKLNRIYALLSRVNQTIVRVRERQALFDAACSIAVEQGGLRMAWIGLVDLQTKRVRPVARAGEAGGYLEKVNIVLDGSERGRGPTAKALRAGEHIIVNDIANDPRMAPWRAEALALGYRASAAFPLAVASEVRGTLNLYASEPGFFDDEEVKLLDEMAADIAFALESTELDDRRKHAEVKAQLQLQRLRALHAIDLAIISSLDLGLTLSVLLEQVVTQLSVDAADVLLIDRAAATLQFAGGRGFRSRIIQEIPLRLGECLAGRVVHERRLVHVPNLTESGRNYMPTPFVEAESFVAYYGVPLIAKGIVKGVLQVYHRSILTPNHEWLDFLETLAGQAAIAVGDTQLLDDLQRSNTELVLAYDATIEGWSRAMDLRDKETEGHSQRVADLTVQLAQAAGMSGEQIGHVRRGALLHDMGKLGIPDSILLKPGQLTEDERAIMRKHPEYAFEMLSSVEYLRPALEIPYCHHERWDGTGYPRQLKGEQIPPAARLFAVADVWDALHSDRPYRAGWLREEVLEHIRAEAGKHFEPSAVDLLFQVLGESTHEG